MADRPLTEQQKQALQTMGAGAAFLAVPGSTILPFQDYLNDDAKLKIKQKEAQRLFPQADPSLFNPKTGAPLVPLTETEATNRIFGQRIGRDSFLHPSNTYSGKQFYPEYLTGRPGKPSPELGSYSQTISNKTIFPEGDIQAITVTPAPNPSRFAKDYAEILADKLGKAHVQYTQYLAPWGPFHSNYGPETSKELNRLERKIEVLESKTPGTAGYVWGNIEKPQYSYAEGNWGLGQKETGSNPTVYMSRINANPLNEAKYLYTGDILTTPYKEPRVRFKQYKDLGPGTGPSWGINEENQDISFRKDLIGARGELTTGDLQALLAERNLPFVYQTTVPIRPDKPGTTAKPGDILRQNLEALAQAENSSTAQILERYARLVPNVGEPSTPPTPAVTAQQGRFPAEGPRVSPFGSFASKTDLRQLGILPASDKATYSPFNLNDFDTQFKHVYPRYGASTLKPVDTYTAPVDPSDIFGNMLNEKQQLVINRDVLRPQAANKLLNRTTENLIEQAKPLRGFGLGGLAAGGVATVMDPGVIDALAQGNYQQAGTTAALNTAIGSAVGGASAKGLQLLQQAGFARPAAAIAGAAPLATGALAGTGLIETGRALNRAYKGVTGKDWVTRSQPSRVVGYAGPTQLKPRMGTAVLGGKTIQVPYGSVAGQKTVGRPWWDVAGSRIQKFADLLNRGSIIGR